MKQAEVSLFCRVQAYPVCAEGKNLDIGSILVRHGVDTDAWGEGPDGCQQTLLHRSDHTSPELFSIE
jgi:hypothetical protein